MIISNKIEHLPEVQSLLRQWDGTVAVIYGLTITHRHLKIELITEDRSKRMTIGCVHPNSIHGPLEWTNAHIQLEHKGEDAYGTPLVELRDEQARLTIECEGVAIIEILEN